MALTSLVNIAVRLTVSTPLVVNAALISFTSARNGRSDPAVDTILVNQFIHWNLMNGPHTVRSQGSPSFVSSGTLGASGYTLQCPVAGT